MQLQFHLLLSSQTLRYLILTWFDMAEDSLNLLVFSIHSFIVLNIVGFTSLSTSRWTFANGICALQVVLDLLPKGLVIKNRVPHILYILFFFLGANLLLATKRSL